MPHDVVVVGARVAGATTAMLLARRGLRVLVLDRERLGRDTLSTHALMRGAVRRLAHWGLLDGLRDTPALLGSRFHYGATTQTVDLRPGGGIDALYAPRRTLLDPLLVGAARRAGAEIRHETTVSGLLRGDDGCVAGVVARPRIGTEYEVTARLVVGADGARSLVARTVRALTTRRGTAAGGIAYRYISGLPADRFDWYYGERATAGVIPTGDGMACVWVGVPGAEFRETFQPDLARGHHAVLTRVAPDLAAQVRDSRAGGPVRAHPGLPGALKVPHGPGWAIVGDAGYVKDPITAHGITDALRDAELLAEAVAAHLDGDPQAMRRYHHTRDALSYSLLAVTDRIASYRWDLGDVRELLLALSRAQRAEDEAFDALHGEPAAA